MGPPLTIYVWVYIRDNMQELQIYLTVFPSLCSSLCIYLQFQSIPQNKSKHNDYWLTPNFKHNWVKLALWSTTKYNQDQSNQFSFKNRHYKAKKDECSNYLLSFSNIIINFKHNCVKFSNAIIRNLTKGKR